MHEPATRSHAATLAPAGTGRARASRDGHPALPVTASRLPRPRQPSSLAGISSSPCRICRWRGCGSRDPYWSGGRLVPAGRSLALSAVQGVRPGQALSDAQAVAPEALAVEADPAADAALLERLALWAMRFSPLVAMDEAR